jgi:hypothetical protein
VCGKAEIGVKSLEKLKLVKKGKFQYKTLWGINFWMKIDT